MVRAPAVRRLLPAVPGDEGEMSERGLIGEYEWICSLYPPPIQAAIIALASACAAGGRGLLQVQLSCGSSIPAVKLMTATGIVDVVTLKRAL